jgi:signal transduction histidine kinase
MATMADASVVKVLLVEDNPADADLIRFALEEAELLAPPGAPRFELVQVDRLSLGEERLRTDDVGVVLLDLSLPDSQGLQTFVRVGERSPETPVVVLSGLDDQDLAIRAVREGAQDYLVKGQVDGVTLTRALRYAIERKRAEQERTRLLREQDEAEAAIRIRDEILASISHDLKTPITSIRGHAQLLARRLARGQALGADDQVVGLGRIERATTQMTGMIDELLDVARLQTGRPLELHRVPTDLVTVARNALADAQQTTDQHTLRFECAESSVRGLLDGPRLDRVLGNLLGNAVKYSPDGGDVILTLVRDETSPCGVWAELRVRDHGIGIPATELPNVFERFYRASNVAGQIRGTGIGLAGARQIVEQHGGTISVHSREGEGTTVTVRLPLGE